ncbi:unnamed protein product [Lampetra fluviatilis]
MRGPEVNLAAGLPVAVVTKITCPSSRSSQQRQQQQQGLREQGLSPWVWDSRGDDDDDGGRRKVASGAAVNTRASLANEDSRAREGRTRRARPSAARVVLIDL